jgi:hypothetical protein
VTPDASGAGHYVHIQFRFLLPCHPNALADLPNSTANSEQPVTASDGFNGGEANESVVRVAGGGGLYGLRHL